MKALFLVLVVWGIVFLQWMSATLPPPPAESNLNTIDPTPSSAALPAAKDISTPPTKTQAVTPAPEPEVEVEYTADFALALEVEIHEQINVERVKNGLKVLKYDTVLADVARLHSADMAKANYFAHEDDDGCDSACRVNKVGYKWRAVGENLFLLDSGYRHTVSDAAAVFVQGWMGSEGHRKNVLQKTFTYEGLGVAILGDKIYATELFARPQ